MTIRSTLRPFVRPADRAIWLYYAGAIMNFELVESSIAYSKDLVHHHFPRVRRQ